MSEHRDNVKKTMKCEKIDKLSQIIDDNTSASVALDKIKLLQKSRYCAKQAMSCDRP